MCEAERAVFWPFAFGDLGVGFPASVELSGAAVLGSLMRAAVGGEGLLICVISTG
jgi:hypothetical protein